MGDDDNVYEAADAAARLQAWFKAEGPLVMDEADFDDVQTVLAENGRMRAELDNAHRRFDALVHADKAKQGAADWMLNRLHDDRLIDNNTYTLLCGLLRDQIDATRHLTHSEDWGPLTDRFRAAVKRARDAGVEVDRLRTQMAEASTLLGHFVDHEDQPCRLNHHGVCEEHGGSSLRPCDVAAGRELLARIRNGDGGPGCLCPHTYQPNGRLVRDGVLALGCPVHDPDASGAR